MKQVIFAATLSLATLIPISAYAFFVCDTVYFPDSGPGVPSRVRLTLSSGPSCSGTQLTVWFCEKAGTTSTFCASSSGFRYERSELLGLNALLAAAAHNQQDVTLHTTNCNGGATGCGAAVAFRP